MLSPRRIKSLGCCRLLFNEDDADLISPSAILDRRAAGAAGATANRRDLTSEDDACVE
jgi:hypothetical protein